MTKKGKKKIKKKHRNSKKKKKKKNLASYCSQQSITISETEISTSGRKPL